MVTKSKEQRGDRVDGECFGLDEDSDLGLPSMQLFVWGPVYDLLAQFKAQMSFGYVWLFVLGGMACFRHQTWADGLYLLFHVIPFVCFVPHTQLVRAKNQEVSRV